MIWIAVLVLLLLALLGAPLFAVLLGAAALGDIGEMFPDNAEENRGRDSADMLQRARAAGFTTLVLTADVPVPSRRERQVRSGLTSPPRLTPRLLAQVARCPAWVLGMARMGMPRMKNITMVGTSKIATDGHSIGSRRPVS